MLLASPNVLLVHVATGSSPTQAPGVPNAVVGAPLPERMREDLNFSKQQVDTMNAPL